MKHIFYKWERRIYDEEYTESDLKYINEPFDEKDIEYIKKLNNL